MELIPVFPLHTVLYPGGRLPLRIFEARYVDMVSECLQTDQVFGVSLITSGSEVGAPADCHDTGTAARIVDFSRLPDGLLGIVAVGERRYRIETREPEDAGLLRARVRWLGDPAQPVAPRHAPLRRVLDSVPGELPGHETPRTEPPADACGLGYRLAELLPLDLPDKQVLLEIEDPDARLDHIAGILRAARAGTRCE